MTVPPPPTPPPGMPAPTNPPRTTHRWLIPLIAGAVVLFLCCVGGVAVVALSSDNADPEQAADRPAQGTDDRNSSLPSETSDASDVAREEEPEPEPEPVGFGAGVWEVGTEIPPGTYVTVAPDGAFDYCYWARLSGFSGSFDDIIANDNLDSGARGRVTISDSDTGVEFTGPCRWVEESESEPVNVGDEVGPGVWRVGDEIAPGTYVTTAPDGSFDYCYWARLSGFSGELDEVLANDLIEPGSRGRVEISSSDVGIKFTGDCVWTRN